MVASIDWIAFGTMIGALAAASAVIGGTVAWASRHIVKPLRIVTGEPETDDDPGKPSLYQLTKEAKDTGEKALGVATEARDVAIEARDVATETRDFAEKALAQVTTSNGKTTAQLIEETASTVSRNLQ